MISATHGPINFVTNRHHYVVAVAVTIMFAALLSASHPGREFTAAAFRAVVDFKVLWICLLVALWLGGRGPRQELGFADVFWGGTCGTLAALTAGLWPWLFLSIFAAAMLARTEHRGSSHALYLVVAIGLHEAGVNLCSEIIGDALLRLDASIAQFVTGWFLPGISASGATLQLSDGHIVVLVWGCSSLSYVGEMMLLTWALALLLAPEDGPGRGLWRWLLLVAMITIALNAARLALMATDPGVYHLLHDGVGSAAFRIVILSGAALIAWLQSNHARSRHRCSY